MRRLGMISLVLLATSVAPSTLSAANVSVEIAPTRIDWLPRVDSERVVLTVSGPGDLFIRREFEAGSAASLSLSEPDWERLPDGSYTWELRVIPHPVKQPLQQ